MTLYFNDIGAAHFFAACASLALGLVVLLLRKGTKLHRALGLLYAFAMLTVNGTALMLYHMTGHFGVFHVLALISLSGLVYGVVAAIFRWRDWLVSHYHAMSGSYVGLLAAACGEAMVRVPALHVRTAPVAIAIGVGMAIAFAIGGRIVIRRLRPSVLARLS